MKTLITGLLTTLLALPVVARPLLDLVDIQGVRDNQLVGYGLVVGLPGSGDKTQIKFAAQSLNNMLKQFGVQLDESSLPKIKKRRRGCGYRHAAGQCQPWSNAGCDHNVTG